MDLAFKPQCGSLCASKYMVFLGATNDQGMETMGESKYCHYHLVIMFPPLSVLGPADKGCTALKNRLLFIPEQGI
jgi:hypothetical protein